ncbi:MAG: GWxTD domain-containing protein [Gracilimonas sp.]|uniref:GWxTD domain-containing protein n=1 Tax=Gracilimonas sp. TaxID=1974203 RepID=UPI0037506A9F|nr:GWxTD domain-containing protein [Gracilimonas sp.]
MSKRILALLLFVGISTSLIAQRVSYPQLVNRAESPTIFIDNIILPGDNGNSTLAFIFRFNNDFIPFKRISGNDINTPEEAEFYSTIRLNAEIFEGKLKRRQQPSANSVARDTWRDTLFTANFEETQSKEKYASGALSMQLAPGTYNFMLQLSMMQEVSERNTQRRNITVPDLNKKDTGEVYLIKEVNSGANITSLRLMNMQNNVLFGEDFHALVRIPHYDPSADYNLKVNNTNISKNDTTSGSNVFSYELKEGDVHSNSTIELHKKENPSLRLIQGGHPFTYALVQIPASQFESAPYLLTLTKDGEEKPVVRYLFRTYWPDMPASLYNLNISIDMLKYILSKNELERIKRGNEEERERKFREFWEQRDPTPNTVYNELMAEYYQRIDYAFKEFGSQENPMGHENDQGEVYIKYGPPNEKERIFPPNGKTREIWKYSDRTFVFEASTGFGDFVLVGTR